MSDPAMTVEERNEQLNTIAGQQRDLVGALEAVTACGACGWPRSIKRMVRCLYCSIWYCERCAEEHFGETRADYRKRNPFPKEPAQ
jgi:predicted sulfurtransferase